MSITRIVLANVRFPSGPEESIEIVLDAMKEASEGNADIICFPESIVPGYQSGSEISSPDQNWLNRAWAIIDSKAGELGICVILGTERVEAAQRLITARVTNADGSFAGIQDKVQLDPSEELAYVAGKGRRLFQCGKLTFGLVICHEGWRYPETVRWAVRNGAQVVFHPHMEIVENGRLSATRFADPENSFHEKAALCRAAENTCYFATVNCAVEGASTTSAIIDPEGRAIAYQPYGKEGVLFGNIELEKATGLLAKRLRPEELREPTSSG